MRIVLYFGWNYVVLIVLDDIYGWFLVEMFKSEVKRFGVCLVVDILIFFDFSEEIIRKIVEKFY